MARKPTGNAASEAGVHHGLFEAMWEFPGDECFHSAAAALPDLLDTLGFSSMTELVGSVSMVRGPEKSFGPDQVVEDLRGWVEQWLRRSASFQLENQDSVRLSLKPVRRKKNEECFFQVIAKERPVISSSFKHLHPLMIASSLSPLRRCVKHPSNAALHAGILEVLKRIAASRSFQYGYFDVGVPDQLLFVDAHWPTPASWEGALANAWWNEYGVNQTVRARGVFWANAYGRAMGMKLRAAGIEQLITDGIEDFRFDEGERPQLHWGPNDSLVVLLDDKPLEFAENRDKFREPETALLVATRLREALSRASLL
jgi:hypothetical protein